MINGDQHNINKLLSVQILKYLKQKYQKQKNSSPSSTSEINKYLESFRKEHTMRQAQYQESEIFDAINILLEQDRIEVQQDPQTQELLYSFVDDKSARMFNQMDFTEKQIYKLLQQFNDFGATPAELRTSLNNIILKQQTDDNFVEQINTTQLAALLKKMEKSGVIKQVKGQQQNRKKVYMLSDIDPNTELTGGAMGCSDPQQFETINMIMDRTYDYICIQNCVTKKDIIIFMKSIGVQAINQDLDQDSGPLNFKDEDFERIIDAMIFDQKIERNQDGYYVPINYSFPYSLGSIQGKNNDRSQMDSKIIFTEIPCCHCPLAKQCSATDPNANITPKKCTYFQIWEMQF